MHRVLLSWIGSTDLRAVKESDVVGFGPIAQALAARECDEVVLLTDYDEAKVSSFREWISQYSTARVEVVFEKLSGPTNFGEIYQAATRACTAVLGDRPRQDIALTFHLSPGTPAMAAVWILLGKTRFTAELIESSREHGVRTVSIPFDIAADFIPDLLRDQDKWLRELGETTPPAAPEFADIIHRSHVMTRLIQRARRVSTHNVPVLLEGESGTGKEMLARAIHQASPRRTKPFIAVNCGAIPTELIESELFGHERGAFTGAATAKKGYFESATNGTLFLDEIGDLPPSAQVKLLRALQEGEIVRLGATNPTKVDVRIVAATNRNLPNDVASGRFREDLFYRLAVADLKVPPLRERPGDLNLLVDRLLEQVNLETRSVQGFKDKKLSAGARNILLSHHWPGNVRELLNTLKRAVIWSNADTLSSEEIRESLLPTMTKGRFDVLGRPLGHGLNLQELLNEVARHYLGRAMNEANGNKTKAAQLVGLPSYQTLTNWLSRYLDDDTMARSVKKVR